VLFRSLVAAAIVMLGATGVMVGAFFLNSLYLQTVLGYSALESGFAVLPLVVAIGIAAHVVARAGTRVVVVVGLALTAIGALLFALAPDRAAYVADLLPGFVVLGLGLGLVLPAVSVTAMSEVEHPQAGLASGLMSTAHEIGAALGVAVLSAVAAAGASPAIGYNDAFLAAAGIAGALAVAGLIVVPSTRPMPGARLAPH